MKEIDSVDEWEYFQNEPDSMREIMLMYLTLPCVTEKCKDPSCTRYHNQDQRRRNPFKNGKIFYTPKKCLCLSKDCKTSTCIKYPDCEFSHNAYEMMYHPWCFKTKPCENKDEHRDRTCPYYHNMDQKRIPKSVRKSFEVVQEQLDYTKFKTHMCNNNLKHNEKQCVYYHGAKDKRRLLNLVFYIPEICIYIQSNKQCPNGEFCNRSHNQVEMFYHPEKFKSKFCSHYVQDKPIQEINDDCPYGGYCSFAHSHEEIRIKLIHEMPKDENFFMYSFKTVLCPFDKGHDKSFCVYAHNLQDFRRQPLQYYYNTNNCPRWDNKKTILTYTEGCEKGYGCMNCHGWKELDFHPLFYKTRKCKYFNNNCSKGALCPFYHVNESKR